MNLLRFDKKHCFSALNRLGHLLSHIVILRNGLLSYEGGGLSQSAVCGGKTVHVKPPGFPSTTVSCVHRKGNYEEFFWALVQTFTQRAGIMDTTVTIGRRFTTWAGIMGTGRSLMGSRITCMMLAAITDTTV
jgi:hypothetical protein